MAIHREVLDDLSAAVMHPWCIPPHVLPQLLSRRAVKGLHYIAALDEDQTIVHQRSNLVRALRQRPAPRQLQGVGVVAIDLMQRAVAEPRIVAAPDQPVPRRRAT